MLSFYHIGNFRTGETLNFKGTICAMTTQQMPSSELYAWLRLSLEPNLSANTARLLLANFGLPPAIYQQSVGTLSRYLDTALATQMRTDPPDSLEQHLQYTLQWAQGLDQHILCLADPHYPQALLQLPDPPLLLYAKGDLTQLQHSALAIVGSRSATTPGLENAYHFAHFLADQGWCIISGLATGIDTVAHQGALAAQHPNSTIAVLGTGMDLVYPARNRDLAHQIAARGLLLSEFPLQAKALPFHFIRRNRLVAALSQGVLVVEAALKSGSLTTARLAAEFGREVFAVPGSIHSPLHKGCHQLIRQGAKLVESAEHILEELGCHIHPPSQPSLALDPVVPENLAPEQQQVLQALGFDPASPDLIQQRSGLSTAAVGTALVQLELLDLITAQADGRYLRT